MAGVGSDKLVEIKFDERQLRRIELMLRGIPKALPQVISRAINRTASPAKTDISKEIREEINATAKRVNERLILKKATYQNWVASIHISRRRLPLMAFGAKQTATGVSYQIKKGGGRKTIKSAFTATMMSGHEGVFKRKGEARFPIAEKFGPSIGMVFESSESLISRITAKANEMLKHNIDSQLDYVLSLGRLRKTA